MFGEGIGISDNGFLTRIKAGITEKKETLFWHVVA